MSEQPPIQELPLEHQKWVHELNRQDAQRAHDRSYEFFYKVNDAVIRNADAALRAALLINGGAAVAVLAFIGALASKDRIHLSLGDVANSLIWFGYGVSAAVAAMALSYFTNYLIGTHALSLVKNWEPPYQKKGPWSNLWHCLAVIFHVFAIAAGTASLVVFIFGMYGVRSSIEHLAH